MTLSVFTKGKDVPSLTGPEANPIILITPEGNKGRLTAIHLPVVSEKNI